MQQERFRLPDRQIACRVALQFLGIIVRREDFGVRWQSATATPLWNADQHCKSGVALRFPPHSKEFGCGVCRVAAL
jgi:hypothetical protein